MEFFLLFIVFIYSRIEVELWHGFYELNSNVMLIFNRFMVYLTPFFLYHVMPYRVDFQYQKDQKFSVVDFTGLLPIFRNLLTTRYKLIISKVMQLAVEYSFNQSVQTKITSTFMFGNFSCMLLTTLIVLGTFCRFRNLILSHLFIFRPTYFITLSHLIGSHVTITECLRHG